MISESEVDVEDEAATVEPAARPRGAVWTGPMRALSEATDVPKSSRALWSIAADL